MEKAEYFYVVFDDLSVPHVIESKAKLIEHIFDIKRPRIQTYDSEQEAQQVITNYDKEQTGQSQKSLGEVCGAPKKIKPNNEADSSNSARKYVRIPEEQPKRSSKDTDAERAASVDKKSTNVSSIPSSPINPIYANFRENETSLKAAKALVNPFEEHYLYFDGGSRGNPGNAGSGYVIYGQFTKRIYSNWVNIGVGTNNKAEYCGLIFGMKSALDLGIKVLETRGDSNLITKQMNGEYKVKNENLKPLYQEACRLKAKFDKIRFTWVAREENSEADGLANRAMDSR